MSAMGCWRGLFLLFRIWRQTLGKHPHPPGEGNGTPLQYSCLENPMDRGAWWAAVHGVAVSRARLSDFTFTFHFHALEKEMATHSSVLAWRIPGMVEPGRLPSMGSHRVGHDWLDLAAAAAAAAAISSRAYQESSSLTCYPCSSSQHPPHWPHPHAYGSRGLGEDRRGNDQKEIELSRFLGRWSRGTVMACFCALWGTICYFPFNNLEILETCKNRVI